MCVLVCVCVRCVDVVWVCVYLRVLGRSDLNSGDMVYKSPWV